LIFLVFASGAAPQQEAEESDGAPVFSLIYLNCASVAAPKQGVAAPDRAPDFWFVICFD
jgi:hypothetical protein